MSFQVLTLKLDGINAGDYMDWVRDPEPPALDVDLREVSLRGDPLGDTVEAVLTWAGYPPEPVVAAPRAGLPLTPEVVAVRARELAAAA